MKLNITKKKLLKLIKEEAENVADQAAPESGNTEVPKGGGGEQPPVNPNYDPKLGELIQSEMKDLHKMATESWFFGKREHLRLVEKFKPSGGSSKEHKQFHELLKAVALNIAARGTGDEDLKQHIIQDDKKYQIIRKGFETAIALFGIPMDHPKFKEIWAQEKAIKEGREPPPDTVILEGFFSTIWSWIKSAWNWVVATLVDVGVAESYRKIEQSIRALGSLATLQNPFNRGRKTTACAIAFAGYPLYGHAGLVLIKDDKTILYADFGRYGAGARRVTSGSAAEYNKIFQNSKLKNTKANRKIMENSVGTVRKKQIKLKNRIKYEKDGDITDSSRYDIMMALSRSDIPKNYVRGDYSLTGSRVAWLKDVDVKIAERLINTFKTRPYSWWNTGEFSGWVKSKVQKDSTRRGKARQNSKRLTKKIRDQLNAIPIDEQASCATFVMDILNGATKSGASIGAEVRSQLLASPHAIVTTLANEFDERLETWNWGSKNRGSYKKQKTLTLQESKIRIKINKSSQT